MGCDIHLYIEYREKNINNDKRKSNDISLDWRSFGGRINPGRNYALFALMADVRNFHDQFPVSIPPRGIPSDIAMSAGNDNKIYITDNPDAFVGETTVTMDRAKTLVEDGSSEFVYLNSDTDKNVPFWITNPDFHSHSWLTTVEFANIFDEYLKLESAWYQQRIEEHAQMVNKLDIKPNSWMFDPPRLNIEPEYQIILASMKRFEELGYESRIVFWFDN